MIQKIGKIGGASSKNNYSEFQSVFSFDVSVPSGSAIALNVVNVSAQTDLIDHGSGNADFSIVYDYLLRRKIAYAASTSSNGVRFEIKDNSGVYVADVDSENAVGADCSAISQAVISGNGFVELDNDRVLFEVRNWRFGSTAASVNEFCFNTCLVSATIGISNASKKPVLISTPDSRFTNIKQLK